MHAVLHAVPPVKKRMCSHRPPQGRSCALQLLGNACACFLISKHVSSPCAPQVVVAARPAAMEAEEAELGALQVRQLAADTQFHAEVGTGGQCCWAAVLPHCRAAAVPSTYCLRLVQCWALGGGFHSSLCLTFPTRPQPWPPHLNLNRCLLT